jgi:hypothetical protein
MDRNEQMRLMTEARRTYSPYVRLGHPRQPGNIIYDLTRLIDEMQGEIIRLTPKVRR